MQQPVGRQALHVAGIAVMGVAEWAFAQPYLRERERSQLGRSVFSLEENGRRKGFSGELGDDRR